jgi:hypothetical protein
MGTSCSSGDANDKTARRQNDGLVGRRWARRTAHLSPAGNRARDTERRFSCGGRSVPVRSTPARVTLQRQYRSADPRRHRNAIRARTRAQIESTQIVRPRPHRTRGRLVEGVRGTGDLSTLGHRDGGAPELAICSMHARTEGVPERARDRATPVPPNAGMMAHGVAAHPLRASLCGLAATGIDCPPVGSSRWPPTLRYEALPWFMWRATSAVRQVHDVGERVAALPKAMSLATTGGCASARSGEPPPDHTARVCTYAVGEPSSA